LNPPTKADQSFYFIVIIHCAKPDNGDIFTECDLNHKKIAKDCQEVETVDG